MCYNRKIIYIFILYIIAVVCLCRAGNVTLEFPEKCGIKDGECQTKLLEAMLKKHAKIGIPDIGLPAMDPYEFYNTTVSVLGMVNLTMIDGKAEGLTNCPISKYEINVEKGVVTSDNFCESVRISGHYKITAGPLVQSLSGNSVSGDGNGAVQIDKMLLKMRIPFQVEQRDDDEIYIIIRTSDAEYSTNNIEKITFEIDNVMLGNQEVSKSLTTFMNNNWRIINRSFGKIFSDKVMELFFEQLGDIFKTVPAKHYISDDLTPYIKT